MNAPSSLCQVIEEHWRMATGQEPPHASVEEVLQRFFEVAASNGRVICSAKGSDLEIIVAGDTPLEIPSRGISIRPWLAHLAFSVDALRCPNEPDETQMDEQQVEKCAARLQDYFPASIPPQLDTEASQRQSARAILKNEFRKERFARLGLEMANPYGFEAEVEYPLRDGTSVRFRITTSNKNGKPYAFAIQRLSIE